MNAALRAYYVLRYLGPRFVWQRVGMAVHKRLGDTRRRFAPRSWESISLASLVKPGTPTEPDAYARYKRDQPVRFLFPLGKPPALPAIQRPSGGSCSALEARVRLLAKDRCTYLFHAPSPTPIEWHVNALTGQRSDAEKNWFELPDFSPQQGDLRTLWDPARAAWAIDLARIAASARDRKPAEPDPATLFWRWLDSFMTACPPFRGPQWKCGQESSVRMIAVSIGFWSLAADPAFTAECFVDFARLAWATGYRVYHHVEYAVSQKNNHALSEACGLLLISQLFPEFKDSPEWRDTGRRVLAQEMRRQIYRDGSYVQHSTNYHRVMLDICTLALRLAEIAGDPFDRDLYDRLGLAADFLFQTMDPSTGGVPNYGNNDGAWVLPLCDCDFLDFRPAAQAAHYLARRQRYFAPGPWDESLAWLFGETVDRSLAPAESSAANPSIVHAAPVSSAFDDGGYFTLRSHDTWAMIRCHTYRDRPAHVDMLHVDLWWRGLNVLRDCGTYQYYVPDDPRLELHFKSIAAHNTVEIDGRDPLRGGSRFLLFPWPRATERRFDAAEYPLVFEGEHHAYDRPPSRVLHRRTVIALDDDSWVIVDDVLGRGEHGVAVRWHAIDAPFELDPAINRCRWSTPEGDFDTSVVIHSASPSRVEVVRGVNDRDQVQGFASEYYARKRPIPILQAATRAPLPLRIVTTAGPAPVSPPRFVARNDRGELWEFIGPGGRHEVWLGRCERGAVRTLLGATDAPAQSERPVPAPAPIEA